MHEKDEGPALSRFDVPCACEWGLPIYSFDPEINTRFPALRF